MQNHQELNPAVSQLLVVAGVVVVFTGVLLSYTMAKRYEEALPAGTGRAIGEVARVLTFFLWLSGLSALFVPLSYFVAPNLDYNHGFALCPFYFCISVEPVVFKIAAIPETTPWQAVLGFVSALVSARFWYWVRSKFADAVRASARDR